MLSKACMSLHDLSNPKLHSLRLNAKRQEQPFSNHFAAKILSGVSAEGRDRGMLAEPLIAATMPAQSWAEITESRHCHSLGPDALGNCRPV